MQFFMSNQVLTKRCRKKERKKKNPIFLVRTRIEKSKKTKVYGKNGHF